MSKAVEIIRLPEDFELCVGNPIMSNFDGAIEQEIADVIIGKPLYSNYTAWNFCGYVWWQDNKWHCEVWHFGAYVDTFSSETLSELMSDISDEYGYQ